MTQPDLLRNSPAELVKAYREAADTALRDLTGGRSKTEREYRSDYYRREAERIEREQMRAQG